MRIILLATGLLLALGLTALLVAEDAEAAPLGGSKLSIAPDVFIGFGTRCAPRRRIHVVRRRYYPRTYVRPTTIYRPYTYRPYTYAYPRVHLGYGHYGRRGHAYPRHSGHRAGHGSRRVVGRRR